ncbi:hypothetical protein [Pleurocapsa sp. PCC 7319]|uniref:hypothetical protein n=1 Tax=Pleurocapsa sp. PCC 7319 TaxID=118161 RepID=UPI0003490FCB|nr:hypothetical protein [Pleurocapsa sp. PCC 7319]
MNNDVYQQIWNSDRHRFLVSPRDNNGNWLDPEADILLDEQIKAFGKRDLDLAQKPLFYRVNEVKLDKIPTFVSLIKLLDNYKFANQQAEIITRAEKTEIEQFIDDICQTKPIKIARHYINNQLKFKLSPEIFRQNLISIWFDLYTNYFGGIPIKDASAFEHIFVGEGKYDFSEETNNIISGAISGYHSWIKFYLDEKQQRVNYLGHNYDLQGDTGIENPYVVTLQMLWQDHDAQENLTVELFKKKGCFFVGTSPECEIAMGTVAYYENLAGYKFRDKKRRTTINGVTYDLALYRNIEPDGKRGNYIRSFYPIFLGTGN